MKKILLLAISLFILSGCSNEYSPESGRSYVEVATPNSDADVVMYFWYRCPACYRAEKIISQWAEKTGAEVEYRHSAMWEEDAKLFYTLDLMGLAHDNQSELMEYFRYASNPKLSDVVDIIGESDVKTIQRRLNSPYVKNYITAARNYEKSVGSTSVPLIIVGNRYAIVGDGLSEGRLEENLTHVANLVSESGNKE